MEFRVFSGIVPYAFRVSNNRYPMPRYGPVAEQITASSQTLALASAGAFCFPKLYYLSPVWFLFMGVVIATPFFLPEVVTFKIMLVSLPKM